MDAHANKWLKLIYDTLVDILAASGGGAAAGTYTDLSGTIAAGGTSQLLVAANADRQGLVIQNPSSAIESLFINFTADATVDTDSFELLPGEKWTSNSVEEVNIIAVTTGHVFIAKELLP